MQYNTTRNHLILPEYGRNVQKMVEHASNIKDKTERDKCVKSIIKFMGQTHPQLRDIKEFTHKLWDHLFIMSQFQLEVSSPYPKPEIEKLKERPDKMPYPKNKIKFPFYGAALENMIKYAVKQEEGREKEIMTGMIANHMKKCFLNWNKDTVDDTVIFDHLKELSEGKLSVKEELLPLTSTEILLKMKSKNGNGPNSKSMNKPRKGRNRKRY